MRTLITFVCLITLPLLSRGATLHVPGDYSTIQAAIDGAAEGDSISVAMGTYEENIDFLGKNLSLTSESGPETTMIRGDQTNSVVTIPGTSESLRRTLLLEGFTITNGTCRDDFLFCRNPRQSFRLCHESGSH